MGREVAIKRCICILLKTTTNRHDLQRTVLPAISFLGAAAVGVVWFRQR
jgi:hypothetical protein